MKNLVLIAGDSWGQGELDYPDNTNKNWSPIGDNILHRGTAEYLTGKGFETLNLSYPGGSNLQAIDRIKNFLNCNPTITKNILCIVFFYTEWFREMWYYKQDKVTKDISNGYCYIKDKWSCEPTERLTAISKYYNISINLIGGCSDIPYEYHDGLNVLCQSAVNYIITGNSNIKKPVLCAYNPGWSDPFLEILKPHNSIKDLEELTVDLELGKNRLDIIFEPDNSYNYFKPDGVHANRKGHKIITDLLLKEIVKP